MTFEKKLTKREKILSKRLKRRTKPTKYVILGPVKCGQCSLQDYYKRKFPDFECKRIEQIWADNGPMIFERIRNFNPDVIPVIITRNVVDAVTSYYNYFRIRPEKMTFMEFLDYPIEDKRHGNLPTIIHGYYFKPWIERWAKYNPLILSLEEMIKDPDFRHINKTGKRKIRDKDGGGIRTPYTPTPEEKQKVLDRYNKLVAAGL